MTYCKVGFLAGVGGNRNGIGDYIRRLNAAGRPAVIMSYDDAGLIAEAASIGAQFSVANVLAFRPTLYSGHDYLNPDYRLSPDAAARQYYAAWAAAIPAEIRALRDKVWLIACNEPPSLSVDANDTTPQRTTREWGNWWGEFGYTFAQNALQDGLRVLLWGWSAGTPEIGLWSAPGMRPLLELMAANRERVGVAVHEGAHPSAATAPYSPLVNNAPYISGRYHHLFAECDRLRIARPYILISECAWKYNDAPDPAWAMTDVQAAAEFYARDPEVLGVALWYLGGGGQYNDIANKGQQLIAPLTAYALTASFPEPEPQPEPEPDPQPEPEEPPMIEAIPQDIQDRLIARMRTHPSYIRPIAAAARPALARRIAREGLTPVVQEVELDVDGVRYVAQGGRRDHTTAASDRWFGWAPGMAEAIEIAASPPDTGGPAGDPLEGLRLGATFRVPFVVTSRFDERRDYGNGKHEGIDLDIIGGPANSREPVLCLYDGTVEKVRRSTGAYFNYVVVRHVYKGAVFKTWYAHLDDVYVVEGAAVRQGQAIGELGGTGGAWAEHAHINLQVPGHGLSGYVVDDVVDPLPYLSMTPAAAVIDLLDYLRGDGRTYELRDQNGAQRRVQTQNGRPGEFFQVKEGATFGRAEWEQLFWDDVHIWRGADTSPGNGRYYVQSDLDAPGRARWALRRMAVGQTFRGGTHHVQFYRKEDCAPSAANSGAATNETTLVAHHAVWMSPHGIAVADVIELAGRSERFWFGRGYGLVGWQRTHVDAHTPEASYISELHAPGARPDLVREAIPCLQV